MLSSYYRSPTLEVEHAQAAPRSLHVTVVPASATPAEVRGPVPTSFFRYLCDLYRTFSILPVCHRWPHTFSMQSPTPLCAARCPCAPKLAGPRTDLVPVPASLARPRVPCTPHMHRTSHDMMPRSGYGPAASSTHSPCTRRTSRACTLSSVAQPRLSCLRASRSGGLLRRGWRPAVWISGEPWVLERLLGRRALLGVNPEKRAHER